MTLMTLLAMLSRLLRPLVHMLDDAMPEFLKVLVDLLLVRAPFGTERIPLELALDARIDRSLSDVQALVASIVLLCEQAQLVPVLALPGLSISGSLVQSTQGTGFLGE